MTDKTLDTNLPQLGRRRIEGMSGITNLNNLDPAQVNMSFTRKVRHKINTDIVKSLSVRCEVSDNSSWAMQCVQMQMNIAMQWLIAVHCRHDRTQPPDSWPIAGQYSGHVTRLYQSEASVQGCSFSLLVSPGHSCQQLGFPPLWLPKFIVNTALDFLQNIINLRMFSWRGN